MAIEKCLIQSKSKNAKKHKCTFKHFTISVNACTVKHQKSNYKNLCKWNVKEDKILIKSCCEISDLTSCAS